MVLCFCLGLALDWDSPTYVSQEYLELKAHVPCSACGLRWGITSSFFLPLLTSTLDLPHPYFPRQLPCLSSPLSV
jgi:hypothetical protein